MSQVSGINCMDTFHRYTGMLMKDLSKPYSQATLTPWNVDVVTSFKPLIVNETMTTDGSTYTGFTRAMSMAPTLTTFDSGAAWGAGVVIA